MAMEARNELLQGDFIRSENHKLSVLESGWPDFERVKSALNTVWQLRQNGQKSRLFVEQDDSWTIEESENRCA